MLYQRVTLLMTQIKLSWHYYRPQRSCGQGNIFTPVCHSVHREGSASVHAGIPTPPRTRSPQSRHPSPGNRHPPGTTPLQTPQDHTHTPPGADTPPRSRLQHTIYERPVRILLECILVETLEMLSV